MKYIVAGGRKFLDDVRLFGVLDIFLWHHGLLTVISGKCPTGADDFAIEWAKDMDYCVELIEMPADWKAHGKASAGPIRNQQMAQVADGLIAFWDGRSRGTKDMIEKAVRCNLEVHIYRY
jgi:hypothetical protein